MKKSQLHNIKDSGFKIPDSYFDTFEQRLFDKMAVQKDLAEMDGSGFTVPENYFKNFDAKLEARLDKEKNQKNTPRVISMGSWRRHAVISGVAAVLLLMFLIVFNSDDPLSIHEVETASIEAYLNDENLNIYDIGALLDDDNLVLDNFVSTPLTEDSLENYLLNNTSVEDLIFGK